MLVRACVCMIDIFFFAIIIVVDDEPLRAVKARPTTINEFAIIIVLNSVNTAGIICGDR